MSSPRRPPPFHFPPPPPSEPPIPTSAQFVYNGQQYELNASTLEMQSYLGRGAFGTVQKMKHRPSGAVMAVKLIPFTTDAEQEKTLLRQLKISMEAANCPYIVQFFGTFFFNGTVCLCMEFMDIALDPLYRKVHEVYKQFPENVLSVIAFSVLTALQYLRSVLKVMHRDVKPSNVLVSRNGCVKMCDFGISGHLVNSLAKTMVGSVLYMAPERVIPSPDSQGFGITSDVWSFGITMYEVATGRFPYSQWNGLFQLEDKIIREDPPRLPSGEFSRELEDFVSCCLQKQPEDRPKYEALLTHAFVSHLTTTPIDMMSTFVCSVLDAPSPAAV